MSTENQIVPKESREIVQLTESATLLEVIRHASTDPAVNIDKMERLFAMHQNIVARDAEQAFNVAMSEVQAKMRRVAADSENKQTHSTYASYAAIDRVLRPLYTESGFSMSFGTGDGAPPEFVMVVCHVSHKAGHTRKYQVPMPADGKGAKGGDVMTKTHATGSAIQYGMRYLIKMIFNLAIGTDDDGNGAGGIEYITEKQVADLIALLQEAKSTKEKLCEHLKIESLGKMPAIVYAHAVALVEHRRKVVE